MMNMTLLPRCVAPNSADAASPGVSKHNNFLAGNSIENSLKMIEIASWRHFVSSPFKHLYEDFEINPTSDR